MLDSRTSFCASITRCRDIAGLYDYLTTNVAAPFAFDDLLRYQLVHVVSALDKLLHDLIRVGMIQTFVGLRSATERYDAEPISISLHSQLLQASFPPKEALFEQEVVRKLRHLSFQDPSKITDGLSLIWKEKHKWKVISNQMGMDADISKTKLKLIVGRRNAIVHEADIDPISKTKTKIDAADCAENLDFVELCGLTIADLMIAT